MQQAAATIWLLVVCFLAAPVPCVGGLMSSRVANPFALYLFREQTGTTVSSSGSSNQFGATLASDGYWLSQTPYAEEAGILINATCSSCGTPPVSGSTYGISCSTPTDTTLEVWFRPQDLADLDGGFIFDISRSTRTLGTTISSYRSSGVVGLWHVNSTLKVIYTYQSTGAYDCVLDTTLNLGMLYHVVYVRSTGGNGYLLDVYVNGAFNKRCGDTAITLSSVSSFLTVGSTLGGYETFHGRIYLMAYYQTAFTAANVLTNYNAGPYNMRPVAAAQSTSVVAEALLTITLAATDADGTVASYTVTQTPSFGTLYQYNGGIQGSTITAGGTLVTDPNHRVIYVAPYLSSGTDTFMFKANDGELDSTAATVSIVVTAVNHAPSVSQPASATCAFGASVPVVGSVGDVDTGNTYTVGITTRQGLIDLATTAGVTMKAGDGANDTSVAFRGSRTAVNNVLASMTYTAFNVAGASDTVTIRVNDGANTVVNTTQVAITLSTVTITGVASTIKTSQTITATVTLSQAPICPTQLVITPASGGASGRVSFPLGATVTIAPHVKSTTFTVRGEVAGNVTITWALSGTGAGQYAAAGVTVVNVTQDYLSVTGAPTSLYVGESAVVSVSLSAVDLAPPTRILLTGSGFAFNTTALDYAAGGRQSALLLTGVTPGAWTIWFNASTIQYSNTSLTITVKPQIFPVVSGHAVAVRVGRNTSLVTVNLTAPLDAGLDLTLTPMGGTPEIAFSVVSLHYTGSTLALTYFITGLQAGQATYSLAASGSNTARYNTSGLMFSIDVTSKDTVSGLPNLPDVLYTDQTVGPMCLTLTNGPESGIITFTAVLSGSGRLTMSPLSWQLQSGDNSLCFSLLGGNVPGPVSMQLEVSDDLLVQYNVSTFSLQLTVVTLQDHIVSVVASTYSVRRGATLANITVTLSGPPRLHTVLNLQPTLTPQSIGTGSFPSLVQFDSSTVAANPVGQFSFIGATIGDTNLTFAATGSAVPQYANLTDVFKFVTIERDTLTFTGVPNPLYLGETVTGSLVASAAPTAGLDVTLTQVPSFVSFTGFPAHFNAGETSEPFTITALALSPYPGDDQPPITGVASDSSQYSNAELEVMAQMVVRPKALSLINRPFNVKLGGTSEPITVGADYVPRAGTSITLAPSYSTAADQGPGVATVAPASVTWTGNNYTDGSFAVTGTELGAAIIAVGVGGSATSQYSTTELDFTTTIVNGDTVAVVEPLLPFLILGAISPVTRLHLTSAAGAAVNYQGNVNTGGGVVVLSGAVAFAAGAIESSTFNYQATELGQVTVSWQPDAAGYLATSFLLTTVVLNAVTLDAPATIFINAAPTTVVAVLTTPLPTGTTLSLAPVADGVGDVTFSGVSLDYATWQTEGSFKMTGSRFGPVYLTFTATGTAATAYHFSQYRVLLTTVIPNCPSGVYDCAYICDGTSTMVGDTCTPPVAAVAPPKGALSLGAIIGIIIACVVFCCLFILLIICCRRRARRIENGEDGGDDSKGAAPKGVKGKKKPATVIRKAPVAVAVGDDGGDTGGDTGTGMGSGRTKKRVKKKVPVARVAPHVLDDDGEKKEKEWNGFDDAPGLELDSDDLLSSDSDSDPLANTTPAARPGLRPESGAMASTTPAGGARAKTRVRKKVPVNRV